MNQQLIQSIRAEIEQARTEGLDEEDVELMAQGASVRLAREQGVIGEELSPEFAAAIAAVVKQEMRSAHV